MERTLLDIKQAGYRLSLTDQQVRNLCRSGKIKCIKVGKSWVIDEVEIEAYFGNNSCGVAEDQSSYLTRDQILTKKRPIVLSFFSGAMGLDLGLEQAGFETIFCCEVDNACRKTILKNKPEIALIGDINEYDASQIRKAAKLNSKDEIDLIVGGPPCQAFSTAGKRKSFEDERGNVLLSFIDRIIELRPRFAVIENVRGILSAPMKHRPHNQRGPAFPPLNKEERSGGAMYYILKKLRKAGYSVSFNLYNAANFGTPQKRERVFVVCSRDTEKLPYLTPTHSEGGSFGLAPWRTFREVVKDLKEENQLHLQFPEKRLKYYRLLKQGQYWRHLPEKMQIEALGASYYAGGGKTGFLRRIAWGSPTPTLVTHPAMPATDLAHPEKDRPLSIQEYKRVQEFPDNWQIEGSLVEQYKQIGNAVPISLGKALGKLILDTIKRRKIKDFSYFPYSRYNQTDEESWEQNFQSKSRITQLELI